MTKHGKAGARPAGAEIEIPPAMIEAGVAAYVNDLGIIPDFALVQAVYTAMERARF